MYSANLIPSYRISTTFSPVVVKGRSWVNSTVLEVKNVILSLTFLSTPSSFTAAFNPAESKPSPTLYSVLAGYDSICTINYNNQTGKYHIDNQQFVKLQYDMNGIQGTHIKVDNACT